MALTCGVLKVSGRILSGSTPLVRVRVRVRVRFRVRVKVRAHLAGPSG